MTADAATMLTALHYRKRCTKFTCPNDWHWAPLSMTLTDAGARLLIAALELDANAGAERDRADAFDIELTILRDVFAEATNPELIDDLYEGDAREAESMAVHALGQAIDTLEAAELM